MGLIQQIMFTGLVYIGVVLYCELVLWSVPKHIWSKILLCIGLKLQILFPLFCIQFHTQIFIGDKDDIFLDTIFFFFINTFMYK